MSALAGLLNGFADAGKAIEAGKEREAERALRRQEIEASDRRAAAAGQPGREAPQGRTLPEPLSYGGSTREGSATSATSAAGLGADGFAGLLARHEGAGDYDTLFGHSQKGGPFDGVRVSNMTLDEAIAFSDPKGRYAQWVKSKVGRVATPMGAGQIVGTTLRKAAKEMGLDPSTPFNAETQNRIINHLASRRLASASTIAGKRAALRAEWEGFKNVPDSQLDAAIAQMESGTSRPRSLPATPRATASATPAQGSMTPFAPVKRSFSITPGAAQPWTTFAKTAGFA